MAHFAEIDINNKVLRVLTACNQDVVNNGGDQSEEAAEYFKTKNKLSLNGIRWIQTSYNNNFRKRFAGIGDTFDFEKNIFLTPRPYNSWVLNENNDWVAPIEKPETYTQNNILNGVIKKDIYDWNELILNWQLRNKPYPSWIYHEKNNDCFFWAPIDPPSDLNKNFVWDENSLSWKY